MARESTKIIFEKLRYTSKVFEGRINNHLILGVISC